ncbi:low-complexity protein [Aphanothece hegewaldii CCALA 016]|uniref:Low-complexity protein n=1 Tax=Aphanothece hegewaldii CCALA 016 TaxID=2107694 RepID=A0A2T1LR98_9CHRO|nr:pentapeptide repeat-containing protein [Aphanothece hegewaldii]PSF31118.1 low-complexity protein [Aphanothece hegewaldii CCALA 016]
MSIKPDPNEISNLPNTLAQSNGKDIRIIPSPDPNAVPSEPLRAEYLSHLSYQNQTRRKPFLPEIQPTSPLILITSVGVMIIGLVFHWTWVGFSGALVALLLALQIIIPGFVDWLSRYLTPRERRGVLATIVLIASLAGLAHYFGVYNRITLWLNSFKYDEFGSWAEWVGALGQIMIAVLAVYVAWAQYVISKDLTIQQNRITQQQTIDAYFQGISDLALDEEGFLEDWPQERAIADGRTASILSNVDPSGKAQILRFLSQSKMLTPLKRDRFLGRPILDGEGGYAEDRFEGTRVVNLGVMLAGADLDGQDLRWTELSEANMVRANLNQCDLVKANLARTILYEASLRGADLKGARLFYGSVQTASPRSRIHPPNYETGAYTGVVIENADLTDVRNLSTEQQYYCCAWGGEKTRATIPGGCDGIPNQLGR